MDKPDFQNLSFDEIYQGFLDAFHSHCETAEASKDLPYLVLTEEDISFIDEDIIDEGRSVFRLEDFKPLTDTIQSLSSPNAVVYTRKTLEGLCKMSKWGPWSNFPEKKLIIAKLDFKDRSQLETIFYILTKNPNVISKQRYDEIFTRLQRAEALFMYLNSKLAFIFVKENFRPEDFCHEFIHFLQHVTGRYSVNPESNGTWDPIEELAKDGKMTIVDSNIAKLIINKDEIIPYFNSLCYTFENNHISFEDAMETINKCIRKRNEMIVQKKSVDDLANYIRRRPQLNGIEQPTLACLVICIAYKQHMTLLKRTIGNYLKDLKRQ